jgi:DNA-binding GntR family transcriptional regulator
VSRQTVRQAFQWLVADSLVYRVPGRGTFAAPFSRSGTYLRTLGSVDDLLALSLDTELEVVAPLTRCANVDAAARLQLDTDEVMEVTFRRLHEGETFCVTTVMLPVWIGRLIADVKWLEQVGARSPDTLIGLLERAGLPVPIAGAHQSITAVAATPEIAAFIELAPLAPTLRIDRVYFDREGRQVELAITHANPVRFPYRLELRRSLG